VLDFGIAKAVDQLRSTPNGEIKGKLAYMAPEQLRGEPVDRRADVFGAAAVLWETLTGFMLFEADNANVLVKRVLDEPIRPPGAYVTDLPPELDMIVMRGLTRERELRYATAREMALELERKVGIATQSEVSDWLEQLAGETLRTRAAFLRRLQERGGQALLGRAARSDSGRITRSVDEEARDATIPGSTPSVETTRPTEVRSAWPWIAGAFCVIVGAVLLLATRLPSDGTPRERHALEPVAVPAALPVAAPPAPPMTPAAGAAAEQVMPARVESTPPRSKTTRARKRMVEVSAPTVQPAAIAEPKCAPVIYVDGIRRINPDCPQATKPKP
jgi:serine/threonine-protein kinase